MRTGRDAYYNRKGAAAIAGADAASGRLAALKDRLLDRTGNGYQRQKLGQILDLHLAASAEGIADHVAAQQMSTTAASPPRRSARRRRRRPPDPSVMPQATMRVEDAARVVHAGQPPEAVEAGVRAAAGSLVAGVIGDRLDPTARRTLGAAAEMLSNSVAADAWLRDRGAMLRPPAPTGDATLDAVNAADASTAEPLPVVSSGGALIEPEDGIVGTRQRLAEIEERHRALTALNRQEFAANPARLRANQAAIDIETVRSRARSWPDKRPRHWAAKAWCPRRSLRPAAPNIARPRSKRARSTRATGRSSVSSSSWASPSGVSTRRAGRAAPPSGSIPARGISIRSSSSSAGRAQGKS